MPTSNGIGTLSEKSLHAALKQRYFEPGDLVEEMLDGYHIDLKRGPLLIEIQTGNFSSIKIKLAKLLNQHPVLLVYPIAENKWIQRLDNKENQLLRRRSPKKGTPIDLFSELIRLPHLITHPNLSIEIALIDMQESWIDDGLGSWRRKKWSIHDRLLLKLNDRLRFDSPQDYLQYFIPSSIPKPFSVKQLAKENRNSVRQTRKMTYTFRKMGLLEIVDKQGNAHLLNFV